ncbi:ArnT family glycosyltransferase [Bosea sp. NBC_00550]|uniref:ArnT family glycosyltransferase n=1 Tax=Bosea sp. NBC_00550 TaxID=2969621 RepID=UPI00222E1690|nr:hypothetical protein [Bosea sp. NBC_00550]UZF91307.1 hypothetical protein NWE53_19585 [Bosea sp. NBC_00550]
MELFSARRLDFVAVAFLSLIFLFISLFRLGLPGVYYDEALFIPPSAKLFDSCSLNAGIFFKIGCVPIILQPPYIGSLKALLYAPIFGAFGVGVVSIRLPGILILLASNLTFWWFWRRRLGQGLALLLFALVSIDAASIFHARVDWGPYVLQNACKLALLCFVIAWLETRTPRHFALACLIVFVGIFDKLNFLWLIPAVLLGVALVYRGSAVEAFKAHLKLNSAALLASILIGTVWLFRLIIPIAIAGTNSSPFVLSEQFARIAAVVAGTLNAGAYPVLFGTPWPGSSWLSTIAFASTFTGLALLPFLGHISRGSENTRATVRLVHYSALLAVINCVLFACLVATKEAGGPHHAIIFSHLWQLQFVATVGFVVATVRGRGPALRASAMTACAALCAVPLALTGASVRHHLNALDPRHLFSPAFSPAIYDLAYVLDGLDASEIVSVDWGIHNVVFSLAPKGRRDRYSDLWPTFNDLGQGRFPPAEAAKVLRGKDRIAFIIRPAERAVFPNTIIGFEKIAKLSGDCATQPQIVRDATDRIQYLVYQVARSCLG